MSVHDRDKTGETRIRGARERELLKSKINYLRDVEKLVLGGMAEELKDPRPIEADVHSIKVSESSLR